MCIRHRSPSHIAATGLAILISPDLLLLCFHDVIARDTVFQMIFLYFYVLFKFELEPTPVCWAPSEPLGALVVIPKPFRLDSHSE